MDEAAFEKEFFKTFRPGSLIKRFARPGGDRGDVVYLCGEPASATTGAAVARGRRCPFIPSPKQGAEDLTLS